MHQIIQGDCLEVMKTFPDNHFSAIVTDPPYGLHFMGKNWDKFKYKQEPKMGICSKSQSFNAGAYDSKRDDEFQTFIYHFGIEALRIVKPGGHILMFGAPRRYHRQVCGLEDAGWEIRDCLMWIFGSGFPKSHNKFGIEGYGTALKPAYEPIIMAMKPLDGTFKQNAEKWGQAGINIDGCRIGSCTEIHSSKAHHQRNGFIKGFCSGTETKSIDKGRWPANILFDEEAAKMLDKQVFENNMRCKTGSGISCRGKQDGSMFQGLGNSQLGKRIDFGDSGGASRFFYCAKTSSKERNEGLEGIEIKESCEHSFGRYRCKNCNKLKLDHNPCVCEHANFEKIQVNKNHHPTVKPIKLMEYLIKLVMPPKDGLLLDPFAGSGSTILAAKRLGFNAIGIEKSQDYCEIARKRIESYKEQKKDQLDLF